MGDDEIFRSIYLVSLLLLLLPLAVPLARSGRRSVRQAGLWVLIAGLLLAFWRIGEWLLGGAS